MTSATLSMPATVTAETAPRKSGFFARLSAAIIEARMRQVEREIARYQHLIRLHDPKAD
jgi:hypothetical protein